MKAVINGMVAIDRAEIEMEKVTMLVGPNEAGKSTIADCIASTVTNQPLMRGLLHKKDLSLAVRDGFESGTCEVSTDDGLNRLSWPSGEMFTQGEPVKCSHIAVGLVRFTGMKEQDRATYLVKALKALPTLKQVGDALKDEKIDQTVTDAVLKKLKEEGFSKTFDWAKDEGVIAKRDFERLTGTRWGSQKGGEWAPEGYDPEQTVDPDSYAEAKQAVESAAISAAVGTAERERLLEQAGSIDALEGQIADIKEKDIPAANAVLDEELDKFNALPKLDDNPFVFRCPWGEMALCHDKRIEVVVNAKGPIGLKENHEKNHTEAQIKKIRSNLASQEGKVAHARDQIGILSRRLAEAETLLRQAKDAAAKLEGADEPDAGGDDASDDPAEIVRIWEMGARVRKAREIHASILTLTKVQDIVGPEGLRKRTLRKSLEVFNKEKMAPLSAAVGGDPIEIGMDLMVYSGRIPYGLLSAGRRAMVDIVLQCALAEIDGSPLLVIDDVDTIEKKHRPKLLQMLAKTGKIAVLCLHVSYPKETIDLQQYKIGRTWWIQNGTAVTLAEALENANA